MTWPEFNEVIHAPLRLRTCAILSNLEFATFAMVRDELGVSDSVLSKHVATLEAAGYVTVSKAASAGRVRTTLAMTRAGRVAYAGHIAALRAIVADAEPSTEVQAPEPSQG